MMAGSSRSSSPTPQRHSQQKEIQNISEQSFSDSSAMAGHTKTNSQSLPANTPNLSSASGNNTGPGPRSSVLRPTTLRKPRPRKPSFQGDQVTPDMRPVLHLFDIYSRKIYMEGYMCKQDITNSSADWTEYYVELCGPILSFWKIVNDHDSETPEVSQAPSVLNLSNCLVDPSFPENQSVSQRTHVFFLHSIKGEQFYLQAPNDTTLNLWITAIRLSCFEGSRLHEVYTATLIKRPGLKDFGNGTVLVKGKLEGFLQVQFSGHEPKTYWVVVADHRAEDKKKKDLSFTRGQALFYEKKKSKKPFMTLANVFQTYAIYPENPALIERTVSFCVEGSLFPTKSTENKPGDFVILTTDSLKEMTKWLFGFFDSFKLYGRPKELLYDFKNPVSPFFAVPTGRSNTKLFLDLHEVKHVEICESSADVKAAFAERLRQSYNLQQQLPDPSSINTRKLSLPQIVTDDRLSENYVRQRSISNESALSSPSKLRPTIQTQRPNSFVSLTGSSQKSSAPTTPVSPHSPLANTSIIATSQKTQSNKRRGKGTKQIASSDESEDQQGNSESETSDDDDDDENDDPALFKNTQENAKIATKTETKSANVKTDEPISFENNFETFGGSDFVSEIMTAVAERNDESLQEDIPAKKSKPKRSVSFKNQPSKQKGKNKKRLAPLPSDSEDSGNIDEESLATKSDENNSEGESSEDSSLNKKPSQIIINKPGKGDKNKSRVVPQPSDSSDDNEEFDKDDKKKVGAQPQQRPYRQSPPYGQYGPGSKQPRGTINSPIQQPFMRNRNIPPGGNATDEQLRGRSKGKKPIRKGFGDTTEEMGSEHEDNNVKGTTNINKKESSNKQDDYQFELGDLDISVLDFDTTNEPTIETGNNKGRNKNSQLESDDDNEEVLNRTTKVFKPTKQKDKLKNMVGQSKSSDISSEESETNSLTSEEEPLAALVEEGVGLTPNISRPNFNTPPRSVSPNYPPRSVSPNYLPRSVSPNYPSNQRWTSLVPGNDYLGNMGYPPVDNRRSVLMPPNIRGSEYYDDDYMNTGGRPKSIMNSGMMAGRRRVSGGQLDYSRESIYMDDGYYDERSSNFRPVSLIDSMSQSQLSAREQEMIARETGTPLINLPEKQKDPQMGLVGAITARENQRKAMGSGLLARQAELERERAFERERERRLMEQRQQAMIVEREREFLYNRQSYYGDPRSSRFMGNQYLDPMAGYRGSYYENYGPAEDDYDEDDDVPLAVGNSIPSTTSPGQARQSRAVKNKRRDTE